MTTTTGDGQRVQATPTRRGVVRTMVGAALGGAVGPLLGGRAEAAKNRRRKRNDNKKKNKHNNKKGKQRPEGDAPPPPPAPPTRPGFCTSDATSFTVIAQIRRVAQTFPPPRGGRLTDAWVTLTENPAGLDLTVDIRIVGPQGVPSNSVLASAQIVNIPQTVNGGSRRTAAVAFDPPAAITIGQFYALAVTGPDGQGFSLEGNDANHNPCPNGTLYRDDEANGVFDPSWEDLVFAVRITN